MSAHTEMKERDEAWANPIPDPDDAGAIGVTRSGFCELVTGSSAETRTIPDPARIGQVIVLAFRTDGGGSCTITAANGVDVDGNKTILFENQGEIVILRAIQSGTNLRWRVQSEGAATPKGIIELPLLSFLNAVGTEALLGRFSSGATSPAAFSDANEGMVIRWNNHATPDPIKTTFLKPQELDPTEDMVLHILAIRSATDATDLVTFVVTAFDSVVGAALDADVDFGGTTDAMIDNALVQELTLALASADISASNGAITLTIQPTDGLLDTIDVGILGAWIEYTKQSLIST